MSTEAAPTPSQEKAVQIPEWKHEAAASCESGEGKAPEASQSSRRAGLTAKLDAVLSPNRKYFGLSRKVFLWIVLAIVLALLALIIGLAAGLTQKSNGQNLPLPSDSRTYVGDLTYYEAGLGACGETDGQSDDIVSISHFVFDAAGSSSSTGGDSNDNPLCNQMLRASRFDEQYGARRSIDLKVVDRCTGCEPDDLDTTLGAFEKLAPSALGRVDVTWAWLEPVATGK